MPRDWIARARSVAEMSQDLVHGDKLSAMAAIANEIGVSLRTLERDLSALNAQQIVAREDKAFAKSLETLPADAVIAAARWYRYDPEGARKCVMTEPPPSVRDLLRAEKHARAVGLPKDDELPTDLLLLRLKLGSHAKVARGPHLSALAALASQPLPDPSELRTTFPPSAYERYLGLDLRAGPGGSVGLVNAPRHGIADAYARDARKIWQRAMVCIHVVAFVLVVFPDRIARNKAAAAMPLPPSGQDGWPRWRDPAHQEDSAPPSARLASPSGGIVILTSPESVYDDYGN